ncbi:hypothetical protein CYMTET_54229 [Cymbomonas tetramitiformis]|uniref:Uncharacterized protein n=1 Tax=Cymbomonas tetramitiformis TaxID=36881 RepID=A0AAE0BGI7_9CHLO|nr:hypothetical protein CYMTET_54229 [Cymbomonas tetramitiformis]
MRAVLLHHRGFHTGFCNPTLFQIISEERSFQVIQILVKQMQEACDLLVCQTWAIFFTSPARSSEKSGMRLRCKDLPYAISGMYLEAFHEFCSTVTLKGDQAGLAGEVVAGEKNIAYCRDVCKLTAANYALVPVARWFDLHCSCTFGMNLPGYDSSERPTDAGKSSYIVFECFLPKCCPMTDANIAANFRTEQVQLLISTIRSTADALGVRVSLPAGGVEHLVPQAHLMAETRVGILDKLPSTSHAESCAAKTSTGLVKRLPGTGGERSVSLAVLQQHLQYDLQTAAKKIGVCPTTLKKICRQNGIARWPRRAVNKDKGALMLAERERLERLEGQEREGNVESPAPEQQQQERRQKRPEGNDPGATTAEAVLTEQAPITSQAFMLQGLPGVGAEEEGASVSSRALGDARDAARKMDTAQEVQKLPGANGSVAAGVSQVSDLAGDVTGLEVAQRFLPMYLQEAGTAAVRAASPLLAGDTLAPVWQTDEGISRMLVLSSSTLTYRVPAAGENWDTMPLRLAPSPRLQEEALTMSMDLDAQDLDAQVELLRKRPRVSTEQVVARDLPISAGHFYGAEQQLTPLSCRGVLMPRGMSELLQQAQDIAEVAMPPAAMQETDLAGKEIVQAAALRQGNFSLPIESQEISGFHGFGIASDPAQEMPPVTCHPQHAAQSTPSASNSDGGAKNDFVTVKAQLGNIIVCCKQPLQGEGSGYRALLQLIAERFNQPSATMRLEYVDEAGDRVMLVCNDDWTRYVETIDQSQPGLFKLLVSVVST